MPRRTWLIAIFLLLLLLLSTQGIIQAKLFQLKLSVSRERLMNFELSSKALRIRSRDIFQNSDDYRSEIKRNVIESAILNDQTVLDLESSYMEDIGIAIVNSIRLMSLKPLLYIHRERKLLLITKYAFFMERNRRLELAASRYKDVIDSFAEHKSEILAFALLHYGYCLASLGKTSQAITSLEKTIEAFPGTHFSQTAVLLLSLLLKREKLYKEIKNKKLSDIEKALQYYNAGLYHESCDIYTKKKNIKGDDAYRWGRCSEEIGKQKRAIRIYKNLTEQGENTKFSRLANRRLLILGNFYHAGKDLLQIAKRNAIRLKDGAALREITFAAKEQREAVVVKEIITGLKKLEFEGEKQSLTGLSAIDTKSLLSDIGSELAKNLAVKKNLRQELVKEVDKAKIELSDLSKTEKKRKEKQKNIEALSEKGEDLSLKTSETDLKELEKKMKERAQEEKKPKRKNSQKSPQKLLRYTYMRVLLLDGRSFRVNNMEWEDDVIKLQSRKSLKTYIPSSLLKAIKLIQAQGFKQKKAPRAFIEVHLEDGESFKTPSLGILTRENKIEVKGKSYKYEDIEKITFSP